MTKVLEKAVEAARKLSANDQDEIVRVVLDMAAGEPEQIDPAHLPAVLEGLAQTKQRTFASVEEVKAAFRRFDS